jgi:hypothetical protein
MRRINEEKEGAEKRKGKTRRKIKRKVESNEKDKYGKGRNVSCRERKGEMRRSKEVKVEMETET